MTRKYLMEKYPKLFVECIKEGIELALFGYTDVNKGEDVEKFNKEIKEKQELWDEREKSEENYLQLIL